MPKDYKKFLEGQTLSYLLAEPNVEELQEEEDGTKDLYEIIEKATNIARGFIYCISVLGITGERKMTFERVKNLVASVKNHSNVPVAVGFGVSDKSDVQNIGEFADAAVVGSALINRLRNCKNDDIIKTAESFIKNLVQ